MYMFGFGTPIEKSLVASCKFYNLYSGSTSIFASAPGKAASSRAVNRPSRSSTVPGGPSSLEGLLALSQ